MLSKDGNHYIIKGKRYARLSHVVETMIPNVPLERWRDRVGDEEADRISLKTSDYGTKIHLITMCNDRGEEEKVRKTGEEDSSLLVHLFTWDQWAKKYIKKWIAIEKVVWSDELMVAGTVDRVDEFVGEKQLCIHDLKTGALYDEIGVKLAGYKIMWNEREKRKVGRYSAVQLSRKEPGTIRVREYTNEKYEKKFREICRQYHEMRY